MSVPALISAAIETRDQYGISFRQQLREILATRFGPGLLDPWEYYFFEVFLERYTPAEKRRFIGWRGEIRLDRAANAKSGRRRANDKLAFHGLMLSEQLPLANLPGVYTESDPALPDTRFLVNAQQLSEFLQQTDALPLFIKPVRGAHGTNVFLLQERNADRLRLSTGESLSVATLVERLEPLQKKGVLFQECLRSPAAIRNICGRRLTSVRLVVIVTAAGPEVFSAVWRVPTGHNITDNFSCGMTGNIIADIDLDSGRIGRIVQGSGWELKPLEQHPDTGVRFGAFVLPDWTEVRALALRAAALLPGLCLQHWDIALTDRGPVLLEVNVEGGMRTHQIVRQRGVLAGKLRALMN